MQRAEVFQIIVFRVLCHQGVILSNAAEATPPTPLQMSTGTRQIVGGLVLDFTMPLDKRFPPKLDSFDGIRKS